MDVTSRIRHADAREDVVRCYPVVAELRPHLSEEEFVDRVVRMFATDRFRLLMAEDGGVVVAVAGYRLVENLVSGFHMYVDDLVTAERVRSHGWGGKLLDWLEDEARRLGCHDLQLDSGVQRFDAHRFYFRRRMWISGYHFRVRLH